MPYFERAAFRAAMSQDAAGRLSQIVELLATLNARTWQLDAVWRDAAASEPSIREQATRRELERRTQLGHGLDLLLQAPVEQQIVDTVWILTGSDVYAKLVTTAGLSHEEYVIWLTATLGRLLGQPAVPLTS